MQVIHPNLLESYIEREAYRVCRLLTAEQFVKFCSERGRTISKTRLRRFERLGIFYPIMRIYRPDLAYKVRYSEDGRRYTDLGQLEEGEDWEGEVRHERAQFCFSARYIQNWRENRLVWSPQHELSAHTDTIDTEPGHHEAYYSQFQIFYLSSLIDSLTMPLEMERYAEEASSATSQHTLQDRVREIALETLASKTTNGTNFRECLGYFCQFISDRYYPETQTDERRITTSSGSLYFPNWNWYEFVRGWKPDDVASVFEVDADSLRRSYDALCGQLRHVDPLAKWHDLVRFVKLDKRKQLKGDALYAQTLLEMALMLRSAYRDLYGEEQTEPYKVNTTVIHAVPDVLPSEDPLKSLELVANDFGVNPQPNVVLFLEGETEQQAVPLIFDMLFGASPSIFGIEIQNLGGIDNAAGGKENPYSALWRLIDYLHHHQIISMVMMDNEGVNVKNLRKLPRAHSIHSKDRYATRKEYIKIWRRSFEFDNFSNKEIANTLSQLGKTKFTQKDVGECRRAATSAHVKGGKKRTLSVLYHERTGKPLDKVAHAELLIGEMFSKASATPYEKRPVCKFLDKVAELAARNHKPFTQSMWQYNQLTGFLGTLKPGAVGKRRKPFEEKRKKKAHS